MTYKEYGKDFYKKDSATRFMVPFIFATEFRDEKRFARYVSKIKSKCDRAIRKNFLDDECEDETADTYEFIRDAIKAEAHERKYDRILDKVDGDIEDDEDFDDFEFDELNDDGLDLDDGLEDECEDKDDWLMRMDDNQFKFFVKHQLDEAGVEHDLDIQDEIEDNFSYFYNYAFEDPREDDMWDVISHIFFAKYLLDEIKSGRPFIGDEDEKKMVLEDERRIIHNYNTVQHLVQRAFEECCFEYLYYRIAEEGSTITYDNYTIHAIPKGDGEALWIVRNAIDRATTDLLSSSRDENSVNESNRSIVDKYREDVKNAISDRIDAEDELEEEKEKNLALRKKLEGFEETKKKEFEALRNENSNLHIEKSRLEKKNASLEEECERLRKQLAEMMDDEDDNSSDVENDDAIDTSKVDTNKRYVFVMDSNPYGKAQLLKAFPNSSIVDDFVELNPNGVDVVVCITSRVKHYVYNSTKDYCKQKGIKFVHCVQNNVEMIKRVLAELDL